MAKRAYIGVDGVARKIKKGYVGVADAAQTVSDGYVGGNGVARKIKKAYLGVGGVARPCWSGGEVAYYGAITPLSKNCVYDLGVSTDLHAVFFTQAVANAYDRSLVRSLAGEASTTATFGSAAAAVDQYALQAGGSTTGGNYFNSASALDQELTKISVENMSFGARTLGGASAGHHAIFAGGWVDIDTNGASGYDSNLTRTSATLVQARSTMFCSTAKIGGYGFFAGGANTYASYAGYTNIDFFDENMTRSNPVSLSVGRSNLATAATKNYALVAGGGLKYDNYRDVYDTVDVITETLTRLSAPALSVPKRYMSTAAFDQYVLFAGGEPRNGGSVSVVESYNSELVRKIEQSLPSAFIQMSGAAIGDYALFNISADMYAYKLD